MNESMNENTRYYKYCRTLNILYFIVCCKNEKGMILLSGIYINEV